MRNFFLKTLVVVIFSCMAIHTAKAVEIRVGETHTFSLKNVPYVLEGTQWALNCNGELEFVSKPGPYDTSVQVKAVKKTSLSYILTCKYYYAELDPTSGKYIYGRTGSEKWTIFVTGNKDDNHPDSGGTGNIQLNRHFITCDQDCFAEHTLYFVNDYTPASKVDYDDDICLVTSVPPYIEHSVKGLAVGQTSIKFYNNYGDYDICDVWINPKSVYNTDDKIRVIGSDNNVLTFVARYPSSKRCFFQSLDKDFKNESFSIPSSAINWEVCGIDRHAFSKNKTLKTVFIPETVGSIGQSAFWLSDIEYITIPKNTLEIHESAFRNCANLKEVIFEGYPSIDEYAFASSAIENVYLPELEDNKSSLKSISKNAFYLCPLRKVHIPSCTSQIGEYAFNAINETAAELEVTCLVEKPFEIKDNVFKDKTYENGTLFVPNKSVDLYKNTIGWKNFKRILPIDNKGETENPEPNTIIYEGLNEDSPTCDWTFESVNYNDDWTTSPVDEDVWIWTEYRGKYFLKANAYEFTPPFYICSMAMSPAISVKGMSDFRISFDHAAKFQSTIFDGIHNVRLFDADNYNDMSDNALAYSDIPVKPTPGSWNFVNSGEIKMELSNDNPGLENVRIGLYYFGSSEDGADAWEVKNIKMTATPLSGVEDVKVDDSSNYPIEVYNLNGCRLGNNFDNLPKGIYIIRQGTTVRKIAR